MDELSLVDVIRRLADEIRRHIRHRSGATAAAVFALAAAAVQATRKVRTAYVAEIEQLMKDWADPSIKKKPDWNHRLSRPLVDTEGVLRCIWWNLAESCGAGLGPDDDPTDPRKWPGAAVKRLTAYMGLAPPELSVPNCPPGIYVGYGPRCSLPLTADQADTLAELAEELAQATADSEPAAVVELLSKPEPPSCEGWPTVSEAAREQAVGKDIITKACNNGALKTNGKTGRARRIDPASLIQWNLKRANS